MNAIRAFTSLIYRSRFFLPDIQIALEKALDRKVLNVLKKLKQNLSIRENTSYPEKILLILKIMVQTSVQKDLPVSIELKQNLSIRENNSYPEKILLILKIMVQTNRVQKLTHPKNTCILSLNRVFFCILAVS